MTRARQTLGRWAEEMAAARLEREGFRIVARNARTRYGEIDLIGLEGRTLAFIEVKSVRCGARAGPERPALAVGRRKQLRLRRLAKAWLAEAPRLPPFDELRFDVIGISVGSGGGIVGLEHIRAAF